MNLQTFTTREEASAAAADFLAETLKLSLASREKASLLVSGGSSPIACYEKLSTSDLDWSRVTLSLTDERDVPVTHEASNEAMVRRTLMQNAAADASFLALSADNVETLSTTLSCALVGMGEDGHFASIFPDNPNLRELVDEDAAPASFPVTTVASEHPRTTANLPLLQAGMNILLLVFGDKKRAVLEAPGHLPIASLLAQKRIPLHVYWAP